MPNPSQDGALVFITLAYAPIISGAERHLQDLCERWVRQGQEIWIITRQVKGSPNIEIINGVQVYRLRSWWVPFFSWITFSLQTLLFLFPRRHRIHSIWSKMLNVTTGAAVLAGRFVHRPVVTVLEASGAGGNLRVMERSFLGHFRASILLSACRFIIVLNDEMVEELRPYKLPSETVVRIPNGVDIRHFQPANSDRRAHLRREWHIASDQIVTLFVGRLEAQKNLFKLLEGWELVYQRFARGLLFLAGGGSQQKALNQRVASHKLTDSVRFLGVQPAMLDLYQAADIFILPSIFEGQPIAILEAMACALPVIVSRIAGNLTMVGTPELGVLIDPEQPREWTEHWYHLLTESDLRRRLGTRARQEIVDHYSIENIFEKYQQLVGRLSTSN